MAKKHTSKEWLNYISQWKRSGLSQESFCRGKDLRLSTFGYWKKKLRETPARETSSLVQISIPIKADKSTSKNPIILHTPNHYRLELTSPVDYESLKAILEIL